jgi:arylsulfatase A-like enzyme
MSAQRPNILLIMCDQLRWDAVGFAGNPIVRTPNLDRLAGSGVCFENAYCASPVCSPARASWLTGLYPHAHKQLRNYGPIRGKTWGSHLPPCTTIGDVLKQAGYRCGMIGPWHLGDDHLPQHGFVDYWKPYRYQGPDHPDLLAEHFDRIGVPNIYEDAEKHVQYGNTLGFADLTDPRQQRTTWTIDHSIEFLKRYGDESFFLFASIKDPHPLMVSAPELLDHYPLDDIPLPDTLRDPLAGKPAYHERSKFRIPGTVTDEQIREMIARYYALVTHIDTQVGRLLGTLDSLKFREDTIVVFMSDHGEMLGDHGFTEKCLMYEASVRVPCLVSWPQALPAGSRVTAPLSGVDLMPTLLDLAIGDPPRDIDGHSVANAIRAGHEPDSRPIFAEIAGQEVIYRGSEARDQFAAHVMVRDGKWKYVWNRFDTDELYDLESDTNEMRNLALQSERVSRISELRHLIVQMVKQTGPGPYHWCSES